MCLQMRILWILCPHNIQEEAELQRPQCANKVEFIYITQFPFEIDLG